MISGLRNLVDGRGMGGQGKVVRAPKRRIPGE